MTREASFAARAQLRTSALFSSRALAVFLALILLQGFHMLEHIVQVVQRYALGIPDGNGILGSLTDTEFLHVVYNTPYLGLLVAVYLLLGLDVEGPRRYGWLVFGLLTFALVSEAWHEIEHVFKVEQSLALGQNGTGGIFGQGPGALAPLFPLPLLHLAYNAIGYLPALAAFVLVLRRGTATGRRRRTASAGTSS